MTPLLNGQATNDRFASTNVTGMRGSMRLMKRAQVAPPNPAPTTTTRPAAPCAMAGSGMSVAPAAAALRKSRRLVRVAVMIGLLPQFFCAPYQVAMALVSSSEKPLAMRSITVDGRCPDLNACMAATMSAGLRPVSGATAASAVCAGAWHPEQESAPGGASAGLAAEAWPINVKTKAVAVAMQAPFIWGLPNAKGVPFALSYALAQLAVFERQGADALARRCRTDITQRRREDRNEVAGPAPVAANLRWQRKAPEISRPRMLMP